MPWEPLPTEPEDPPGRIGESLDRLVRHLGGSSATELSDLFTRWPEMVGPDLASHAEPVSLRGGTLTIAVADPAWATQLRFLEPEILAKVAAVLGSEGPNALEVKVRRRG